ncbi:DUF2336 domain-containing protein [Paremcibacter congregatus]|uniref:DUF2336 domain-containing protein n=1 Tax=Paremcibacter congregatus TaxID=2043170 RepID=UPI0030EB9489|tara:strand:- start:1234 stop:2403 length:1170 start_codon:yes stop_codon:yes gene_type:complete
MKNDNKNKVDLTIMGMLDSNIASTDLILLAQQKSISARNELVENISDMFLSPEGRLTEHERALMNDILAKLINSVEKSVKKELSSRLANADQVSSDLAKQLASDSIDIAGPMLRKSSVLKDEDLIEIIRNRSDAHRMAIAIRSYVSEEVSSELIDHGSEDVVEALIRNENAEISELSMKYLVAESKNVDRFQEPLLSRQDLPIELAHRMYWWVSAALRRKIVLDYNVDDVVIDDLLEMATKTALRQHEVTDSVMLAALKLAREMAGAGELDAFFLQNCLRQEKVNLFVASLSEMCGLDVKIIWRSMRERTGESLAIIMKSLDVDRDRFASLFLLIAQSRSGGRARATSLVKSIVSLYDDIKVKNAKVAVRHWQRDFRYQNAMSDIKDTT